VSFFICADNITLFPSVLFCDLVRNSRTKNFISTSLKDSSAFPGSQLIFWRVSITWHVPCTVNLSTPPLVCILKNSLSAFIMTLSWNVVSPSTSNVESNFTSELTWKLPLTSNWYNGFCWFIPTLDCLYIAAPAPVPWWPHKSWVKIVATPVTVVGSCAVGIKVSVPWPLLFLWTKLRTVNDWAAPTAGTKVPSSCKNTPSVSTGVNETQRIPSLSRLRKFAFAPTDPANKKHGTVHL